jgi:hypothetical protein
MQTKERLTHWYILLPRHSSAEAHNAGATRDKARRTDVTGNISGRVGNVGYCEYEKEREVQRKVREKSRGRRCLQHSEASEEEEEESEREKHKGGVRSLCRKCQLEMITSGRRSHGCLTRVFCIYF